MTSVKGGRVYLIGAGPGDLELLTLKAVRCIGEADVILLDSLVNPHVLTFARPDAKTINVGKRGGKPSISQDWITRQMVMFAKDGLTVARIKGGDPLIFARGGEELQALSASGIAVEVISGVTAGIAVPAALGIPLTHRDYSHQVIFLTGSAFSEQSEPPLPDLREFAGTLVIYMGLNKSRFIIQRLLERGLSPTMPIAAIQAGTTDNQRFVFSEVNTFTSALDRAGLVSPVIIIVGQVVAMSPHARLSTDKAEQEIVIK